MPLRTSALRSLGCAPQRVRRRVVHGRARRGGRPRPRRVPAGAPVRPARPRGAGTCCHGSRIGRRGRPRDVVGHGIGYARYKNSSAYCAVVAEVEAVAEVRVRRLTVAVDAGLVINPDGAANQIEGGAIQATSWTVKERVAVRPVHGHQRQLGDLSDPALLRGSCRRRRVPARRRQPATRRRRMRAGADGGRDRQRGVRRAGRSRALPSADAGADRRRDAVTAPQCRHQGRHT